MILMAKKIIEAVKTSVKKVVKKEEVKKEVVEVVPVKCSECGGRGLLDQHTLCSRCEGHGTV